MKRLILIAALAVGLTLTAVAEGAIPQPIYFWGTVVMLIKGGPGQTTALPEVIRPSGIEMSADGSWYLEHLHWTGWGSSVAHATGDGNASNDIPNVAGGKRIKRPAQVALSNPGLFQGHEVYRCFTLTVPSLPRTDQHMCLTDQRGIWFFGPTSTTGTTTQPTTATPTTSASFYSPSHNLGLSCGMGDGVVNGVRDVGVSCQFQNAQGTGTVSMGPTGKLKICVGTVTLNTCDVGVNELRK